MERLVRRCAYPSGYHGSVPSRGEFLYLVHVPELPKKTFVTIRLNIRHTCLQWAVVISALRGFAFESLECADAWPYVVYTVAIMACFLAAMAIECVIAYAGAKGMPCFFGQVVDEGCCEPSVANQATAQQSCCIGSLFEEQKRRSVPRLIVAHLVLSVCTVAVNVCGSWLLHSNRSVCGGSPQEWRPNSGFTALVWTTWVVLLVFMLSIVTPLQLFPGAIQSDPRSWRFRCALLACCCCRWRCDATCTLASEHIHSTHEQRPHTYT